MSEARNRAAIDALVAAINARNLGALDKVFTEDIIMEWPQSGERIRGGSNRREIYSRFPSLPTVTPRRTTGAGDVWVLEANLDYGDGDPYQAVSSGRVGGIALQMSVPQGARTICSAPTSTLNFFLFLGRGFRIRTAYPLCRALSRRLL